MAAQFTQWQPLGIQGGWVYSYDSIVNCRILNSASGSSVQRLPTPAASYNLYFSLYNNLDNKREFLYD